MGCCVDALVYQERWARWEWRSVGGRGVGGKQAKAASDARDHVLHRTIVLAKIVSPDSCVLTRGPCPTS
jgi:hypothetical protein